MGPIWVLSAPDGPHVGPMNFAFRVALFRRITGTTKCHIGILFVSISWLLLTSLDNIPSHNVKLSVVIFQFECLNVNRCWNGIWQVHVWTNPGRCNVHNGYSDTWVLITYICFNQMDHHWFRFRPIFVVFYCVHILSLTNNVFKIV